MAEEELEEEFDDSSDSEIAPSQPKASTYPRKINVPYDVFVSYSPTEGDWVQNQLLPRMESAGLYVAIEKDRKRKPSKQSLDFWREKLELSRIMLPVFSTNYFKSEYSIRELEIASKEGILIIPILVNGFDVVPDELKRIKIHDFSQVFAGTAKGSNAEPAWNGLVRDLSTKFSRTERSASNSDETNQEEPSKGTKRDPSISPAFLTESGDNLITESGDRIIIETPDGAQNQADARPRENVNVDGNALSDAYSIQDLLGYDDYVEALANFIESPKTKKPITIGIDAVWGGGKTSLMHMLEKRLNPESKSAKDTSQREPARRKDEHFYTIWFDAWQYDQQEMLWAALVLEILRQVRKQYWWYQRIGLFFRLNFKRFDWSALFGDIFRSFGIALFLSLVGFGTYSFLASLLGKTWADAFEWIKDYMKVFAALGIASLAYTIFKDTVGLVVSPFNLGISRYAKDPDYKAKIGFVSQFREDFQGVVDSVTRKGKWPLVIFIDDLDRCSPTKAAEVIEAINLLLDSEHCVFVIGMDAAMLARSIQAKYKDIQPFFEDGNYASGLGLGRHFLEKIIQVDFRIPQPDPKHFSEFILAQLGRKSVTPPTQSITTEKAQIAEGLIKAEERAGKTRAQAKHEVQENHPDLAENVKEAVKAVEEKAFEEYPEVEKAIQEMAPFLDYNPRRVKRFINVYRLQALIAYERGFLENLISLDNLARWVVIGLCWPEFINLVVEDSRIVADIKVDIIKLSTLTAANKKKELISIKDVEKYPTSIIRLLTDPDFEKLINSIDGTIGESQNYLGLNQLFMVQ